MIASKLLLSALLIVLLVPAVALADSIQYTESIPLSTTNWTESITIPKFDVPNCDLEEVCFTLEGHVEGLAMFESLDAEPATITMNLQATIELQRPDSSVLATVIPLVQTVDYVTEFDGDIDFGGTSGRTYDDLAGDATEDACTQDPGDLALFTGTGDIILPAQALGSSFGSGAGNLVLQFNTYASVSVTVTYIYTCPSPVEESTWGTIKALYR